MNGKALFLGGLIAGVLAVFATKKRRNNPLNLVASSIHWQGENTGFSDKFESFETMVAGVRAGVKNLYTYFNKHRLRTIMDIVERHAPPHENPTIEYANYVAKRVGVPVNAPLQAAQFDKLLPEIVAAMARFEQGHEIPRTDIIAGIEAAKNA